MGLRTNKRYEHTLDICFTLEAGTPHSEELSRLEVIEALLNRIVNVIHTDDFPEASGEVYMEEIRDE